MSLIQNHKIALGFNEDTLLTDQEAAELARVSPSTVRYWRQTGLVPFVKVGKHPRIWLSEFNRVFNKPDNIAPLGTLGDFHE
jgi:excisionase family DNA binding protein